jgi:hypothetical protein
MLLSADAIAEVLELLHEDDFWRPAHRTVFRSVLELHSHGEAVDAVTVAEHLRRGGALADVGGAPFLHTLVAGVPTAANAAYYARIVQGRARQRRLIDAGHRAAQIASEAASPEQAAEAVRQILEEIAPDLAPAKPAPARASWPVLDRVAYHGIVGEVVDTLTPATEADPAALLVALLAMAGNAIGPGPHAVADGAEHPARLFAAIVGDTSRSRKSTARARAMQVMRIACGQWARGCQVRGLASGEALIEAVRDGTGDDPGVIDKRALVVEDEFARLLVVAAREGATLSATLRTAWDGLPLENRTKRNPSTATGAHVSVIAAITVEELRRRLTDTEVANGFANRFLFALARRSKLLPEDGHVDELELERLGKELGAAVDRAQAIRVLRRSPAARAVWAAAYTGEFQSDPGGLVGAVTARPEAQTLRLSVTYALLDGSATIEPVHVMAALAVWRYSEASARRIFGDRIGEEIADRLLEAIRAAGPDGLDGTGQRAVFAGHVSSVKLTAARAELERRGLVKTTDEKTGGRPRIVTRATALREARPRSGRAESSESAISGLSWENAGAESAREARGKSPEEPPPTFSRSDPALSAQPSAQVTPLIAPSALSAPSGEPERSAPPPPTAPGRFEENRDAETVADRWATAAAEQDGRLPVGCRIHPGAPARFNDPTRCSWGCLLEEVAG